MELGPSHSTHPRYKSWPPQEGEGFFFSGSPMSGLETMGVRVHISLAAKALRQALLGWAQSGFLAPAAPISAGSSTLGTSHLIFDFLAPTNHQPQPQLPPTRIWIPLQVLQGVIHLRLLFAMDIV